MNDPQVLDTGDSFIFSWPIEDYRVRFDRLREERGTLYSEIAVQTYEILPTTGRRGHIHRAGFNVSSTQARSGLTKHLNSKINTIEWGELLERCCAYVLEGYRRGLPVVKSKDITSPGTPQFLVERLLPRNETTIIYAEGGSGKSWLGIALALCVTGGQSLPWGLRPLGPTNVLYLDWETHAGEFRRRLDWLCKGFNPPLAHPDGIFYRQCDRSLPDDISSIREIVAEHKIGLVIIDSIAYALDGEPEKAATATAAMKAAGSLRDATRLIFAHVSKESAQMDKATPFGSVFFRESARMTWEMRGDEDGRVALFQRKKNYKPDKRPIGYELIIDDENATTLIAPDEIRSGDQLARHTSLAERIRAALRLGPRHIPDLASIASAPASHVRSTLSRMNDVVRLDDGTRGEKATYGIKKWQ